MGRKKRPIYAVVAADSRFPRDGRYLEDLGRYDPLQDSAAINLKHDRILYWLENGAQPSDTVRSLLSDKGIMLTLHMRRKGAEQEDIEREVSEFLKQREVAKAKIKTVTVEERRLQALREEEKRRQKRLLNLLRRGRKMKPLRLQLLKKPRGKRLKIGSKLLKKSV